jgi:membrane protease YdiL (CAAX protease family)
MSSSNEKELVEYDGNLEREHLLWNLTGLGGLFIVGSLLVRFIGLDTMSSFYVPRLSLQSGVGTLVEDLLYNVVLVAPSEESIKLVGSLVLYRTIGKSPFGEAISIVAPIGFWSLLHAYQNPVYIGHPVLVLSAFFGGLILFALIKVTGSIVNAQIVHSAYNSIILLIQFV